MTRHSDLSIREKLTGIVLLTCGVSILLACTVFAFFDLTTFRRSVAGQLETIADITGANTAAALAFGDAKSAAKTLRSLRAQPHIVKACIYTRDGAVLAKYARPGAPQNFTPPPAGPDGTAIASGEIVLFHAIRLRGERVGTIYLNSDRGEMRARSWTFMEIILAVIVATFLIAYLFASRLQRVISEPILQLARTASRVSLDQDSSLRVSKKTRDEIGFLCDRFHEMIERIQRHEADLQAAHGELELRVDERTHELQKEVAERKQAEAELESRKSFLNSLIENNPVAIVVADANGIVRMCNPAFERLFLYRQEEILNRMLVDLIANREVRTEMLDNWKLERIRRVGKRIRSDGTSIDVEIIGAPLTVEGQASGRLLLYQDITERKAAEEALLRAKETAEAANKAKSEFLANMSHEIRTPMNGIIGMTELALDTALTPEQCEYLGMVKSSADSLLSLVNDILDFSKIEAGKLDIEVAEFSFRESLGETLKPLGFRAHQKGLELSWFAASDIPDRLRGDVGRLRQIVVNLAGNAVKFTHHGEVVVEVSKEAEAEGHVWLHFRVKDTGIGIAKEKQRMIFEAFTQEDGSTTRNFGGTGLGLAITRRLVSLMGGTIWVKSKQGRGSTFHFTARFAVAEHQIDPHEKFDPAILQNARALIVDDNRTNRTFLSKLLESWGIHATTADGAESALEKLARSYQDGRQFSLIISDLQMPRYDGFHFSAEVRKSPQYGSLPILLLSSTAQKMEAGRCRELSIAAYLIKPVLPSELFEAIVDALSPLMTSAEAAVEANPAASGENGMRVLLAEDNRVNRKLATRLLEKQGYTVIATENGREAIEALAKQCVDLVLMDVQMPVMDGLEAIRRIRIAELDSGRHVPIVALTAHAMRGDREKCLEAGADDYLAKPIRVADFLEALDRVRRLLSESKATEDSLAETPESAALNVSDALKRFEGDGKLLEEVARLFAEDCSKNMAEIRRALDTGDSGILQRLAHTLKGSSANIGAEGIRQAALAVETAARSNDLRNAAKQIGVLQAEMDRLLPGLNAMFGKVTQ